LTIITSFERLCDQIVLRKSSVSVARLYMGLVPVSINMSGYTKVPVVIGAQVPGGIPGMRPVPDTKLRLSELDDAIMA
jgi:hypothetical protein